MRFSIVTGLLTLLFLVGLGEYVAPPAVATKFTLIARSDSATFAAGKRLTGAWAQFDTLNVTECTGCGGSITLGDSVFLPGSTQTIEFNYGIVVDLNDHDLMENVQPFRMAEESTEHGQTSGPLPQHFTTYTRDDSMIVYDLDGAALYESWQGGASNALPSGCNASETAFLDGWLYVGCNVANGGLIQMDRATGKIIQYDDTAPKVYGVGARSGIVGRNNALTYQGVGSVGAQNLILIDDRVTSIALARNLMGDKRDAFGRRNHYAVIGTQAGTTIFDPTTQDAYHSASVTPAEVVRVTRKGNLFIAGDNGTEVDIQVIKSIYGQEAAWAADAVFDNDQTDGHYLPVSDAATLAGFDLADWGHTKHPSYIVGTSEGVLLIEHSEDSFEGENLYHVITKITNTVNYPPVMGSDYNVYGMEAVAAVDGNQAEEDFDGTATGDPSVGVGVVGNAIHFDGDDRIRTGTWATANLDGGFAVAFWCSLSTVTASTQVIWHAEGTGELVFTVQGTSGNVLISIDDDGVGNDNIVYGDDVGEDPPWDSSASPNNGWHHLAVTKDTETAGAYRLYIDGVFADSSVVTNANGPIEVTESFIGANDSDGSDLTGAVDEVVVIQNVEYIKEEFIKKLHRRGVQSHRTPPDAAQALPGTPLAVAAIAGGFAVAGADSVILLNALGIPYEKVVGPGGTIGHVDLVANLGALPAYAIGTPTNYSLTVPPARTGQATSFLPPPFSVPQPCVIDSSGAEGLFWDFGPTGEQPLVACNRAGIRKVEWRAGLYLDYIDITQNEMMLVGSGHRTLAINYDTSINTNRFIVSGTTNVFKDFRVHDQGSNNGSTGTSDAIAVSGADNRFVHVKISDADQDGWVITGRENVFDGCGCTDNGVDSNCMSIESGGNATRVNDFFAGIPNSSNPGSGIVVSTADSVRIWGGDIGGRSTGTPNSITINSGANNGLLDGVTMRFALVNNGTGWITGDNDTNP